MDGVRVDFRKAEEAMMRLRHWPRCADGGNGGVRVLNAIPAAEQRISASQAQRSRQTGEVLPKYPNGR